MASDAKPVEAVLAGELIEITHRREACGLIAHAADSRAASDGVAGTLTGLALSGGGVRAGALSLGVLQALYSRGRMRHIDYLSTVSGGGYAGALFSSLVSKAPKNLEWTARPANSDGRNRLDLESPDGVQQPERVQQLAMHGRMMTNSLRFLSRHAMGWVVNSGFAISGVICGAALIALAMKSLWLAEPLRLLSELGFDTDPRVAFFPAFLMLGVWLLTHMVQSVARLLGLRCPPVALISYLLLLFALLVGLVSLLSTGELGFGAALSLDRISSDTVKQLEQVRQTVLYLVGGIMIAVVAPLLRPKQLLESGRAPKSLVQRFLFHAAGLGILVGIPTFAMYVLCCENISGYLEQRPDADQLTRSFVATEEKLYIQLLGQSLSDLPAADVAKNLLGLPEAPAQWRDVNPSAWWFDVSPVPFVNPGALVVHRAVRLFPASDRLRRTWESVYALKRSVDAIKRDVPPTRRWHGFVSSMFGLESEFDDRMSLRLKQEQEKDQLIQLLNRECLSNPRLVSPLLDVIHRASNPLTARFQDGISPQTAEEAARDWLRGAGVEDDYAIRECLAACQKLRASARLLSLPAVPPGEMHDAAETLVRLDDAGRSPAWLAGIKIALAAAIVQAPDDFSAWSTVLVKKSVSMSDAQRADELSRLQSLLSAPVRRDALLEALSGNPAVTLSAEQRRQGLQAFHHQLSEQLKEVRLANWTLLTHLFPDFIKPPDTVYAVVVNPADQLYRWKVFVISGLLFLAFGLVSNLNSTCLHSLYRDQLEEIWLPGFRQKLSELDTCSCGGPLHLFNATLNRMGRREDPDAEQRSRFVMSRLFCGSRRVRYRETEEYMLNQLTVADAIAVSGAAVSVSAAPSLLYQIILFMTNFRLGQWYLNPQQLTHGHYWPSPLRMLTNLLWNPTERSHVFVTDGGHLENLGVASLLERRCRVMIAIDAGLDGHYDFDDLVTLLHSARFKYGINVRGVTYRDEAGRICRLDGYQRLDPLRPKPAAANGAQELKLSAAHAVVFHLQYPEAAAAAGFKSAGDAVLIYCKPTLTGDEPLGLTELLRRPGETFPHDPTSDQFLAPERFAAYNTLGYHIGCQLEDFIAGGGLEAFRDWLTPEWLAPSAETDGYLQWQHQLRSVLQNDAPFAEAPCRLFLSYLEAWLKQRVSRRMETFDIEQFSRWARQNGDSGHEAARELCRGLERLFRTHEPVFRLEPDLCHAVQDVLCWLGGKRFSSVIHDLAAPPRMNSGEPEFVPPVSDQGAGVV